MKKKLNLKGVDKGTWVRTAVLVLALINQILVSVGKSSKVVAIEDWYGYVSYAFTAVASIISWWKNNSFTDRAQEADAYLHDENWAIFERVDEDTQTRLEADVQYPDDYL